MSNSWTGKNFFAQWNQSAFFWIRWTNHGMTWQSRNLRTLRFCRASMMPRPQEPSQTHSGFEAYFHSEWAQFWFSHDWLSSTLDCVAVELVLCLEGRWLKTRPTISAKPGLVPVKDSNPGDNSHLAMDGRALVESGFARTWTRLNRSHYNTRNHRRFGSHSALALFAIPASPSRVWVSKTIPA